MLTASPSNEMAAPTTHQIATFGRGSERCTAADYDRFVTITPTNPVTGQPNVSARA
jgi:hypothetical protein